MATKVWIIYDAMRKNPSGFGYWRVATFASEQAAQAYREEHGRFGLAIIESTATAKDIAPIRD